MSNNFPKPKSVGADVKVESALSNYASKTDLKNCMETMMIRKKIGKL